MDEQDQNTPQQKNNSIPASTLGVSISSFIRTRKSRRRAGKSPETLRLGRQASGWLAFTYASSQRTPGEPRPPMPTRVARKLLKGWRAPEDSNL